MTHDKTRSSHSIEILLVSLLTRPRVAQIIKRTVYPALLINLAIYVYDDWMVYRRALADDAAQFDNPETFSTSIDTISWLGLVFLFELETYALPDEAFDGWMTKSLHSVRFACYVGIAFAVYGCTVVTLDNYDITEVVGPIALCEIADQGIALQTDAITYTGITHDNCSIIAASSPYYRISDDVSLIDSQTLDHVQKMAWVDVANAFVWLIVVFLTEIEVRMQAADRVDSRSLGPVRRMKIFLRRAVCPRRHPGCNGLHDVCLGGLPVDFRFPGDRAESGRVAARMHENSL